MYIYNGIWLNHKMNKVLPFMTTRMDPWMINEISQTDLYVKSKKQKPKTETNS